MVAALTFHAFWSLEIENGDLWYPKGTQWGPKYWKRSPWGPMWEQCLCTRCKTNRDLWTKEQGPSSNKIGTLLNNQKSETNTELVVPILDPSWCTFLHLINRASELFLLFLLAASAFSLPSPGASKKNPDLPCPIPDLFWTIFGTK